MVGELGAKDALLVAYEKIRAPSLRVQRTLPVPAALSPLFPGGAMRRGGTVLVDRSFSPGGSVSLAMAIMAEPTKANLWSAIVGLPGLNGKGMAEIGLSLDHCIYVPNPKGRWAQVVDVLLEGVDLVLVGLQSPSGLSVARKLTARNAKAQGVLVILAPARWWPLAPEVSLRILEAKWASPSGVGWDQDQPAWVGTSRISDPKGSAHRGHALLLARCLEVESVGKGSANLRRRASVWLPGSLDAGDEGAVG